MALFNQAASGIYYTANSNKSVGDPSDKYLSIRPLWDRARAVVQGQRFCKQFDYYLDTTNFNNLLLPFSANMSQRQYDFYRAEAELPGLTSQYARALIGGMLRKGVSINLPADAPEGAYEWLQNEFTADNKSIHHFLNEALWEEIQTARTWVYVDYPPVSEELTVEEQNAITPYPVILRAETVVNWREGIHPTTNKECLTMLITRFYTPTFDENPWHPVYKDTVRVHKIEPDGTLTIDEYSRRVLDENVPIINGEIQQYYANEGGGYKDAGSTSQWEHKASYKPMQNGEFMTYIPAWPLGGNVEVVEPHLQPLIDREVGLYNKISRRNHLLYGAATYTPVVASDMSDEEFENIVNAGLGSWLRVRADESITALETPTQALKDMEAAITNTIEEMAKLGIRLLNPEGYNSTSGVALEIRNAAQTGQLGNLSMRISTTMQHVMCAMLNWRYGTTYVPGDIEFMLSSDFNPAPLGADWMRLVTEWYQAGIIPRSAFLEIAKQNDVLPNDYNDDGGLQEIETDDLIVPVREQFETETELNEAKLGLDINKSKGVGNKGVSVLTGAAGVTKGQQQGNANMRPTRERTKTFNDGSGTKQQ